MMHPLHIIRTPPLRTFAYPRPPAKAGVHHPTVACGARAGDGCLPAQASGKQVARGVKAKVCCQCFIEKPQIFRSIPYRMLSLLLFRFMIAICYG